MKNITIFIVYLSVFLLAFTFVSQKQERRHVGKKEQFEREPKTDAANEALAFWNRARAYPYEDIPDAGYADALTFSQKHLRNSASKTTTPWKSIGPNNFGGRTIALLFNPLNTRTLYAGSASGGLWRTYTGGEGAQAWNYVDVKNALGEYYPVLGVGAIAIDPIDTNTILIGTGEVYGYDKALGGFGWRTTRGSYGIGILKSTDNGLTWTHPLDWSRNQKHGVWKIAFNPKNTNILYAATTEGTYKSSDKGETWNSIHNVPMAMDIAINPQYPETLFVSCGNLGSPNSGMYRSYNGGVTFSKIDTTLAYSGKTLLWIYPASPNVIYADVADSVVGKGLFRSTNNGDSWVQLNSEDYASYQGWYSHFAVIKPNDTSQVLCAGVDIYKSVNGGRTLTQKSIWYDWYIEVLTHPGEPEGPADYSHADHHVYAVDPTNPDVVYFGNDGGVFRTSDFGETYEGLNGGYHTQQFYNGTSNSSKDSMLCFGGLQDNAFVISYPSTFEDGGWFRTFGGDGCWTAIDPKNDSILYNSTQYLYIEKSYTREQPQWDFLYGGVSNANFVAPFVLAPNLNADSIHETTILFAGEDKISKSTNAGLSWFLVNNTLPLDGNSALSMAVSQKTTEALWAGTLPTIARAGIFKSGDAGVNWTNMTSWHVVPDSVHPEDTLRSLPDLYPMDIAIDGTNLQRVYIVFGGYDDSAVTRHVWKTINGGASWSNADSGKLPNVPTNAVVIDSAYPNDIYIGNDLGVYFSSDFGESWSEFSTGMPPSIIMDLSISYSNRMLRAFTHGLGAWETPLLSIPTSIHENVSNVPASFELKQNYPNPFNPVTVIRYSLSASTNVSLKVYDVLGKEVATLVRGRKDAGEYSALWDASHFSSGVYFAQISVGTVVQTRKMLLMK